MWNRSLVRLFGVLLAVALGAAACGSTAETSTAPPVAEQAAAETTEPDVAEPETTEPDTGDSDAAEPDTAEGDQVDHAEGDHQAGAEGEGHSHGGESLDVDASLPLPGLDIELTETSTAGTFALAVSLENFTITPENIDADPIDNEGHMHLYLDGERVMRFTDLEIEVEVPNGEHLIEVELSANNHSPYSIDGEAIRAGATVTGSGEAAPATDAADPTNANVVIAAALRDGQIELDGDDRFEVVQGDVVMVMVSSDTEDEIHVHGYDLFADIANGQDAMIVFEANVQGRFEIELERSGLFIAELVVS